MGNWKRGLLAFPGLLPLEGDAPLVCGFLQQGCGMVYPGFGRQAEPLRVGGQLLHHGLQIGPVQQVGRS